MCLAAVRENGDALPYSELFDVNRLQEFMRTSTHMGDKASGGNRVVTVVERAPPWMQGRRYWDGSDKKAPTLIGSKCSAIAGQRMRSEVDNVLPQAMMVHGASTFAACEPQFALTPCCGAVVPRRRHAMGECWR